MYSTKVISEENQVPTGYVRLTDYRKQDEAAAKLISAFHNDGLIPAVKLMRTIQDKTGPVWVSKQHTDELLAKMRAVPETINGNHKPNQQHAIMVELQRIATAQERMAASMERLEQVWRPCSA